MGLQILLTRLRVQAIELVVGRSGCNCMIHLIHRDSAYPWRYQKYLSEERLDLCPPRRLHKWSNRIYYLGLVHPNRCFTRVNVGGTFSYRKLNQVAMVQFEKKLITGRNRKLYSVFPLCAMVRSALL